MHHAGRLHMIEGEQDPDVSDSLSEEEYLMVQSLVSTYYCVTLTDCGTGISHPAMAGILSTSDNVVIAASYAVITDKDQVSNRVDRRAIENELGNSVKTLVIVPKDKSAADGDRISLDRLSPLTRRACMEIAATIADGHH